MRFGKLRNKGAAIILVAGITLGFLLLFAVLAIDFSRMYYVRGELQNAADSAALAGAKLLDATGGTTQALARSEAQKFAGLNKAAGQSVQTELNSGNDAAGDIVVGNWDASLSPKFSETRPPVNAVKVVARRTSAAPVGGISVGSNPVDFIFGKLISGLTSMGVKREAIAAKQPLSTPGIPICLPSCSMSVPADLILQKDPKKVPIDNGMAWTAFTGSQAPNIGANGDVIDYIWGRKQLPYMCDLCITTNNGTGDAIKELFDAFYDKTYSKADKDFDSNGNVIRWKVAIPVLDKSCDNPCIDPNPDTCACPPGGQGKKSERYHVKQIGIIGITAVRQSGGEQGITIDSVECLGCPTFIPFGLGVKLVK